MYHSADFKDSTEKTTLYLHSFLLDKADILDSQLRKEFCLFCFPNLPLQNKGPKPIGISLFCFHEEVSLKLPFP